MVHEPRVTPSSSSCDQRGTAAAGQARFPLGRILATPGAADALARAEVTARALLLRHMSGDWGDLTEDDRAENELSVREGSRILSAYDLPGTGENVWLITEVDRSATALLLPSEY
jgi:hypothetical protein